MAMFLLLIWGTCLLTALVLYFRKVYSRFRDAGVNHSFYVPILGHSYRTMVQKEHFAELIVNAYNSFPDDRLVGLYEMWSSTIVLRDPEMIKKITIKDFDNFLDHRSISNVKNDPLFGRHLVALKGQEWKDMRSTLSPAFTSSKMRLMLPLMVEVGEQMIKALKKKIDDGGEGKLDIDTRDLVSRYANDVIASCAFGLKVDSLTDEDNEFYKMGKAATTFNFNQLLKMFIAITFPKLAKIFKISILSEESKQFFRHLVNSTMKNREENNITRADMINLLMEAKKGNLTHEAKGTNEDAGFATVEESSVGQSKINRAWSDDDLVAQAFLFFIAGFDTVATAMSFLLHELALHPEVQDKLVAEIRQNDAKNNGKFDYNSIQQMMYMDTVISELLRLWTPASAAERLCTNDYNLGRPNSGATEDYIIRKGESVYIPIWAIHRNPEYFPDPNRFDPDRFSDENKHNIQPFTYIPFGLGPRNCIGSRFALCEVKVMVYQLLKEIEVSPCEKTCIPAKLDNSSFNLTLKGGHWQRIQVRKA